MYRLLAPALLVGFCMSASMAADDCLVPSASAPKGVTLRAAPTASSTARGTLGPGQSLPLVASLPNWYETRLADGQAAFASKRSADIAPCPSITALADKLAGVIFEVHVIDVGTGLSVFVRGPDFTLLYDAGSNDDKALGNKNRTIAYLKTLQPPLQRIDHVVLSHPHTDHVELLPDVVTRYKPKKVWNSGAYNDVCGYRSFLLAMAADSTIDYHTANQDAGTKQVVLPKKTSCYGQSQPEQTLTLKHASRISTDEKIPLGQGATMTLLYADGSNRSSYNENSLVARLDLGSRRVLLMGDAEAGGRKPPATAPSASSIEGKLLACCAAELRADILVVAHHGSKSSSRTKFLDAVGASIAVISSGPTKYSTVTLPDSEIVTELDQRGDVFRTDLDDATCKTSSDKVGPKKDGKPGGCDNVLVKIPTNGSISADYRRVSN